MIKFAIGDRILWNRALKGGQGFYRQYPGIVVRISAKRIRIKVKIGGRDAEYNVDPATLERQQID